MRCRTPTHTTLARLHRFLEKKFGHQQLDKNKPTQEGDPLLLAEMDS
jgi:hypothetical protein